MVPRVIFSRPLRGTGFFIERYSMFKPVNSRVNFPKVEEKILDIWRDGDIFQKSVDNRQGNPAFVMYEGPPTTNASPGLHFAMPRAIKDVFPR